MTAPVGSRTFDVVVLGGGAVGENAAARAVRGGLSVAMVEGELVGGECSYWACMPSKALVRTTQAVHSARALGGVTATFDPAAVLARRDSFTSGWKDDSQVEWAQGAGITVVRGHARLTGVRTVSVQGGHTPGGDGPSGDLVATHAVVVATGSVADEPPIPGLADARHWGSREATAAQQVPASLLVVGSGVVGCELAQAWARLGSTVTLVSTGSAVLERMEPVASELVLAGLRADGITVHLGAGIDRVDRDDTGVHVRLADGTDLVADELLVATGRRPATTDLGVEAVGLEPGTPLAVDDSGLVDGVDGRWLYACGDVTGRAPLTHQGKYAARVVGDVVVARATGAPERTQPWGAHAATADHGAVAQVVFTDPEVAFVGRTAAQVAEAGTAHDVVEIDLAVAGSALHADGYTGRAVMVVDRERQVVLGVTFVGADVAELVHAGTVAIVGEVPLDRLWHAVPAYPTINEIWLRLLEAHGL